MNNTSRVKLGNPGGLYDPSVNGYSHVATIEAGTRLIFLAGQGGERSDGELAADFASQLTQAFDNISIALASSGATLDDVFKLTVLIVDHDELRLHALTEELAVRYAASMKPVCTLIPVPRLALDGMLVEIEAVAAVPAT